MWNALSPAEGQVQASLRPTAWLRSGPVWYGLKAGLISAFSWGLAAVVTSLPPGWAAEQVCNLTA